MAQDISPKIDSLRQTGQSVRFNRTRRSTDSRQRNRTLRPPSLGDVFSETHRIVSDYYAHPDDGAQKFLALYLVHSYILGKSLGTIFIWLVGAKRTGKTTLQMIAEEIGYRAFGGVDPSEASIYRTLGHEVEYAPLVICREYEHATDLMRRIQREGNIPGGTVSRNDKNDSGNYEPNEYFLYGSLINASNKLFGEDVDLPGSCREGRPHEASQTSVSTIPRRGRDAGTRIAKEAAATMETR